MSHLDRRLQATGIVTKNKSYKKTNPRLPCQMERIIDQSWPVSGAQCLKIANQLDPIYATLKQKNFFFMYT